jgi:hypothetical protein
MFINGVYHCSLRYSQLLDFYTTVRVAVMLTFLITSTF